MRVGSNLILKDGFVCQSHNWGLYRKIGTLQTSLNALSRYRIDEINIISLSYQKNEDLINDIQILTNCFCPTPITFGGGINTENYKILLKELPAERYSFCSSLVENQVKPIEEIMSVLGRQSIIGVMPLKICRGEIRLFNPKAGLFTPLTDEISSRYEEFCDEIVIYDVSSDGLKSGFNFKLLENIPFRSEKIILSGGIINSDISIAQEIGCSAVYVDNSVLHYENGKFR